MIGRKAALATMFSMAKALLASASLIVVSVAYAADETWTTTNVWYDGEWTRVADIDGDGRDDIAAPFGGRWIIKKSNGVNAFADVGPPGGPPWIDCGYSPWGTWDYTRVGDFNGDGYDDWVSTALGATIAYVYTFNSFGGDCPGSATVPINDSLGGSSYLVVGDFNGDGYDDLASPYGTQVFMKFGAPNVVPINGFGSATWSAANQWGNQGWTRSGDFNGDNLTDIISLHGSSAFMKLSTGNGFQSVTWPIEGSWAGSGSTFAGDFNGDGYDDIVSCQNTYCHMKYSTGTGFTYGGTQSVSSSWGGPAYFMVGDFEGDGNDDIASAYGSSVFMKLVSP